MVRYLDFLRESKVKILNYLGLILKKVRLHTVLVKRHWPTFLADSWERHRNQGCKKPYVRVKACLIPLMHNKV